MSINEHMLSAGPFVFQINAENLLYTMLAYDPKQLYKFCLKNYTTQCLSQRVTTGPLSEITSILICRSLVGIRMLCYAEVLILLQYIRKGFSKCILPVRPKNY